MNQHAVLVCNGISADNYVAPVGVYVMTINGGFLKRRADGAITTDCPGYLRGPWRDFGGDRVVSAHMPEFPQGERYECEELVKRFASATPAALAWLAQRKGFKRVTVVGLDSLVGAPDMLGGKPKAYSKHVADMLSEMSQYFAEGLWVERDGKAVRVGTPEFNEQVEEWSRTPIDVSRKAIAYVPPSAPSFATSNQKCEVKQNFVELDVSPRCTRSCSFCAPGIPKERRKKRRGISLESVRAVIDELAGLGFSDPGRCVCFCGHGEPLMRADLPDMIRYAREKLPACEIAVYTNCDLLTPQFASLIEAQDARIIADIYDAETADKLPGIIAASGASPERVLLCDHTGGEWHYSSRCQSVDSARGLDTPCGMPRGKLFITDDGGTGPAALLCCEDYGRETLVKLDSISKYLASNADKIEAIASGPRGKACSTCGKCNRTDGAGWSGWGCYAPLVNSKYWPPRAAAEPTIDRRLVILPVSPKWADHAEVLLDTIDRTSTMDGASCVLWNGDGPCPDKLKREGRIILEYPDLGPHPLHTGAPLAWTAINQFIGDAFKIALDDGYDWAIKIDTDTAILRRGWDADILSYGKQGEAVGFMLEENVNKWAQRTLDAEGGIFSADIRRLLNAGHMRWARGHMDSCWLKGHHLQGGCYAVSRGALEQLEYTGVGIKPPVAEQIIGEDVLFSLRCRVAGIKQVHTPAVCSHYFPSGCYHLSVARYYRDCMGASVIHPIKDINIFTTLCKDACRG